MTFVPPLCGFLFLAASFLVFVYNNKCQLFFTILKLHLFEIVEIFIKIFRRGFEKENAITETVFKILGNVPIYKLLLPYFVSRYLKFPIQ